MSRFSSMKRIKEWLFAIGGLASIGIFMVSAWSIMSDQMYDLARGNQVFPAGVYLPSRIGYLSTNGSSFPISAYVYLFTDNLTGEPTVAFYIADNTNEADLNSAEFKGKLSRYAREDPSTLIVLPLTRVEFTEAPAEKKLAWVVLEGEGDNQTAVLHDMKATVCTDLSKVGADWMALEIFDYLAKFRTE